MKEQLGELLTMAMILVFRFERRNCMQKTNFSLNYNYSSDFDFFIRCYLKKMFFYNLNLTISVVSSGGLSDINRHNVYNENIKILLEIKKHFLVFILYKLKIFNFLKDIIKFILPNFVNKMIIKIKYKTSLIDDDLEIITLQHHVLKF